MAARFAPCHRHDDEASQRQPHEDIYVFFLSCSGRSRLCIRIFTIPEGTYLLQQRRATRVTVACLGRRRAESPDPPTNCPGHSLRVFSLIVRRELIRRPDNSVSVLQELSVSRTSQKHIVLGKLRYIRKDVEWDLRKLFGTRVDVRFNVIEGRKKG